MSHPEDPGRPCGPAYDPEEKNCTKRADKVAIHENTRWGVISRPGKPSSFFPVSPAVERKVLPQESGLTLPNNEFDIRKFANESICGSHMINVGVCENDAADRSAQGSRCFAYAGRRSGEARINETEPIVFPDQKTIDHAEASQTEEVFWFS